MKKKFKTIMAMAAALVISLSTICMASAAGQAELSYDETSAAFKDDRGNDAAAPMTFTYDDTVTGTVTVEWGDMNFVYSPYTGWGDSFANGNNKITVTNNTTVPIRVNYSIYIDYDYTDLDLYDSGSTDTNVGFRITSNNNNDPITDANPAIDYTERNIAVNGSDEVYVTISNESPTINGTYNKTEIGAVNIAVYPDI